jgi:tetratricopeptide (TPR) repeat protein
MKSHASRLIFALVTLGVIVWLGAAQLASSAAFGDLATTHSLPAELHRTAPNLLRPLLLGGPQAQAQAAIHSDELTRAATILATLGTDDTTVDLRGQLAQARGARAEALADYVAAGDFIRAQAQIDDLAQHDPAEALREENLLVNRLARDPRASEIAGQAWWRLGVLQATEGYGDPPHRRQDWRDAETSYERALAEAPNDENYLLAAAYQSLANGNADTARARYARALAVDPASAPAYAGLALAAAAGGDCPTTRRDVARAVTLGLTVEAMTSNPTFGTKLAACLTP